MLRKKIESKNTYEHYIYSIRNTTEDEKLKAKILDLVKEHQAWLDSHQDASAEEFDAKYKELEGVFQPIMTQVYQSMGGQPGAGGMPGGMPGGMGGMPGGMGGMPGGMGGQQPQPNAN